MRLVVTEEHAAEFASLEATGIHTAGKTGTAQEAKIVRIIPSLPGTLV